MGTPSPTKRSGISGETSQPSQEDADFDDIGDACDTEGPSPNNDGLGSTDDCDDGVDNNGDGQTDGDEPDCDSDGDGILDLDDTCPNDPEDFDGFEDSDGCPEAGSPEGPTGDTSCSDDVDNDLDGLTDETDPDCALAISIDIKPGDPPNSFKCSSQGVVPVAILGSASFDATTVDVSTVTLEAAGTIDALTKSLIKDVNHDRIPDIVVYFDSVQVSSAIDCPLDQNTIVSPVTVSGVTSEGIAFAGSDTIRISK